MLLPKLIRYSWIVALTYFGLVLLADQGWPWMRHRAIAIVLRPMWWIYPALCVALFMIASHLDKKHAEHLLAAGVVAPAVLEIRDRGIEVGVSPVFTVLVRVTPPAEEPFLSEVSLVPARQDMGAVRKGTQLTVRYDPRDRTRIAVEAITREGGW